MLVLVPALRVDHALWTDPSRAAMPEPDRFQYVLGWPSGYGVRDTERLVRDELARHPDGLTVVVHANRYQNLRVTPLDLALAFAREPRVRLEDWNFADPTLAPGPRALGRRGADAARRARAPTRPPRPRTPRPGPTSRRSSPGRPSPTAGPATTCTGCVRLPAAPRPGPGDAAERRSS